MSTSENTLQFLTVDSTIAFCVPYSSSKSEIDRGSALFLIIFKILILLFFSMSLHTYTNFVFYFYFDTYFYNCLCFINLNLIQIVGLASVYSSFWYTLIVVHMGFIQNVCTHNKSNYW